MNNVLLSSTAFCYPFVNVPDSKAASLLLYWENLRTLVPTGVSENVLYTRTNRMLIDRGYLQPVELSYNDKAAMQASSRLDSLLFVRGRGQGRFPNLRAVAESVSAKDQAPQGWGVGGAFFVNEGKKPPGMQFWLGKVSAEYPVGSLGHVQGPDPTWKPMPKHLALLYLSAVCAYEAQELGLPLVASDEKLAPWVNAILTDSALNEDLKLGSKRFRREYDDNEFRGKAKDFYHPPEGVLADFTIEAITFGRNVSLRRALTFRDKYSDLLALYRLSVNDLTADVLKSTSPESMEERLRSLMKARVLPVLTELRAARTAARLSAGSDILKTSSFTMSPSLLAMVSGHPEIGRVVLAAGIGASMGLAAAHSRFSELVRDYKAPYAYILAGRRAFK